MERKGELHSCALKPIGFVPGLQPLDLYRGAEDLASRLHVRSLPVIVGCPPLADHTVTENSFGENVSREKWASG